MGHTSRDVRLAARLSGGETGGFAMDYPCWVACFAAGARWFTIRYGARRRAPSTSRLVGQQPRGHNHWGMGGGESSTELAGHRVGVQCGGSCVSHRGPQRLILTVGGEKRSPPVRQAATGRQPIISLSSCRSRSAAQRDGTNAQTQREIFQSYRIIELFQIDRFYR